MREKERIHPFMEQLEELWLQYPDFRFGQIINMMLQQNIRRDLYNVRDEEFIKAIEDKYVRARENARQEVLR